MRPEGGEASGWLGQRTVWLGDGDTRGRLGQRTVRLGDGEARGW